MKSSSAADLTNLLQRWSGGDPAAEAHLWPHVFSELKRLARRHLANQRPDHTLQSGALINEVYLRLGSLKGAQWESRARFFALCAKMMRQILVDHARSRRSHKRGGGAARVPLENVVLLTESKAGELQALDDAMKHLAASHPRKSQVVEMRFFGGLSVEEVAEVLGVSRLTVIRDWNFARAWLHGVMNGENLDER